MTDHVALTALGALATTSAIRAGKTSASAVIEHALARLHAENGRLHAAIAILDDQARVEAACLDRLAALGVWRGPLHGVPVVVKDIIDVAGWKTLAGSRTRDHLPAAAEDAPVVRRLRAAGAIVVAKTHTVEYAFGGFGTNVIAGTPVNPHDRTIHRAPGGSSSGSAVAVGAGLVPLAFGTDTGGSIRGPASWCGLVGHKTTIGLVPRTGVVPLSAMFDTVGPMTRTVTDAAVMAQAMIGSDPEDPSTHHITPPDLVTTLERGVRGLTIGMLARPGEEADEETEMSVESAARRLETVGARLVPIRFEESFDTYTRTAGVLIASEGYHRYAALVDANPAVLGAPVAERLLGARAFSASHYVAALERREAMTRAALAAIEGVDVVVMPTMRSPAPAVALVDENSLPGVYTRFVNLFGWCGVSVPTAKTRTGLPIGLQVVARGHDDALALRVAFAIEQAAGGPLRLPA